MVKFADVQEGSVVQLGRLNGARKELSHSVGFVARKEVTRIGTSTWSGIVVEVAPRQFELVAIHNVKAVLA